MAKSDEIGYVYIFTNESFREGWIKIGKTKNLEKRLNDLDNTSCPLPFDVYATLKTSRYDDAEDFVHEFISHFNQSLRIRPNREYFNVAPEEALEILYKVKKLMNEPDSEIVVYDEKGKKHAAQLEKKMGRRSECKPEVTPKPEKEPAQPTCPQQMVWLLPSNLKLFDLKKCYKQRGCVYWQIKNNLKKIKEGDRGYIYSSRPDKAIIYSFEVVKAYLPYSKEMDEEDKYSKGSTNKDWGAKGGFFALLKMEDIKNKKLLTLNLLMKEGLKGAPQGAALLSQKKFEGLLTYIDLAVPPTPPDRTKPVKPAPRKPFDFSMVNLKIGDKIVFDPLGFEVTVADKNKVEYKGKLWSLTGLCKEYLPENMRNSSGAYQGPKYFSYNGKTLWEIRLENEK